MMPTKVSITLQQFCETDDRPLRVLSQAGMRYTLNGLKRRLRQEDLARFLEGSDAVIAGVEPYEAKLLEQMPHLRVISRVGSGTDAIDLDACRRLGIEVVTTRAEVVEPVAQLAVTMILGLARNIAVHISDFRLGQWKKHTGRLLSEWTIGIVGFGQIGRAVERLLRPFRPRILVSDPLLKDQDLEGIECCDLNRLLAQADMVSLHASHPQGVGPLIGSKEIGTMKPGSYLVNTSRGHVVDEAALCEGLRTGKLAGAALDVFSQEPYSGPLTGMSQVICTPHVATLTQASRVAMELRAAQQVADFFERIR